ncbi:hypothetical protein [Winogradskyella marincola]|uniref:Uncharacterized protein n=1 Tax=Winogradskyella marincola TaxID=3037795 RepID=A0ABT6FYL7_9FLAO|nr:hypothetical protein [Winogradskyella sp. YYF002]MDG4714882.1 hypothetical protein [Winogradskyella sp. YYF002]
MKNFELFVGEIVNDWRSEKKTILESAGLGRPSNREIGDLAEDYILRKINGLKPKYQGVKSNGSQTPSDIFSVARRNGFWHIMLIQVKSSTDKNRIYKLNENDKKVFDEFAKFIKTKIGNSDYMVNYKKSPLIISNGYAGVYRNENGKTIKHNLVETKAFKIFKRNSAELDINDVKKRVMQAHKL